MSEKARQEKWKRYLSERNDQAATVATTNGLRRCDHCKKAPVTELWTLSACAEANAERTIHLCRHCDVELTRIVLDFAKVPGRVQIVKRYSAQEQS